MRTITSLSMLAVALTTACSTSTATDARSAADEKPGAAPAGDWTLDEKESWKAYDEQMKGWVEATNEKCGSQVQGTFDRESFRGHMQDQWSRTQCEAVFTAIQDVCGQSELSKKTVKEKLQKVECKIAEKGKASQDFADGKLSVSYDLDGWTPDFKGWLGSKL